MKKLLLLLSLMVFMSCDKSDDNPNCNFLFDAEVNLTVNTNLPQFNQLEFTGNGVYVPGYGNKGIWLWRASSSILYAWDAADPSHEPISCSTLIDTGQGDIVSCSCEDGNQYSLATGLVFGENSQPCTLQPYRVEVLGNGIYVVSN